MPRPPEANPSRPADGSGEASPGLADAVGAACVAFATRRPRSVVLAVLLLAGLLAPFTATHLGVNSDNLRLLPDDAPFRQRYDAFAKLFPSFSEALFVLVEGPQPSRTRDLAEALARRLTDDPARFHGVYLAGSGPFFERHGLLYRSVEELEELVDQLARAQPLIAAIEREPTLSALSASIRMGLEHPDRTPANFATLLDGLSAATAGALSPAPMATPWTDLLLRGSAFEPPERQVLIAEPVLAFGSPFPAAEPIAAIREAAAALDATGEIGVRITGNPALNEEEMRGMVSDIGLSGLVSFALVVAILAFALRSARLVVAAAATLLVGLLFVSAFAAAAVGQLNLISVSFAVLFLGLGIDFAIHLLLHYVDVRSAGLACAPALAAASRATGGSLVLCGMTTTLGFYAFLPTSYRGVAELGLIAGTGMLIVLALTLTFLPALLMIGLEGKPRARAPLPIPRPGRRVPPGWICAGFAALGAAALFLLPGLVFDPDVVRMRNPDTESVQAFDDLLAASGPTSAWQVDVVAPDLAAADRLAARLRALPEAAGAYTLSDWVPEDQDEKLDVLADAALMLAPVPEAEVETPSPGDEISALRALSEALARNEPGATPRLAASMRKLRETLDRFVAHAVADGDVRPQVAELEELLFGEFDRQLARLRQALSPEPVTLEDLPRELVRRMVAPDGRALVQVTPAEALGQPQALERFVDAVQAEAPDATGSAVNLVEFGRATVSAFLEALGGALVAISLLVLLLWRRLSDTACVMVPLLLGSLLTAGAASLLGLSFNFANIIVLPLLLGIGVDSGVHLVHHWRGGPDPFHADDPATTSRAVLFSALTTVASFGSLAFSAHRGIASLGELLVIAMGIFLACNLILLPALLALRKRAG